jgi:hypothetical protein
MPIPLMAACVMIIIGTTLAMVDGTMIIIGTTPAGATPPPLLAAV